MHERTYKERQVTKGSGNQGKGIKGKSQNKNQQEEVSSFGKILCNFRSGSRGFNPRFGRERFNLGIKHCKVGKILYS